MQRRKFWTILALVFLPSAIAVTTLSVLSFASEPAPAAPSTPTLTAPGALEPAPATLPRSPVTIKTIEPEANESDPEQRPVMPTTMVAGLETAPSFEIDSFTADSSFLSSRATLRGGHGRFSGGFGGGTSSGGSGSGPQTGDPKDTEEPVDSFLSNGDTGDTQAGTHSEPTLPDAEGGEPGAGPKNDSPKSDDETRDEETNPSNPQPPYDLIPPIGGDGDGGSEDETTKPHVTVPEPSTWALFGIALLGAAMSRRKQGSRGG